MSGLPLPPRVGGRDGQQRDVDATVGDNEVEGLVQPRNESVDSDVAGNEFAPVQGPAGDERRVSDSSHSAAATTAGVAGPSALVSR